MAKNTFSKISESILTNAGQDSFKSQTNNQSRIIYPAIVRNIIDEAGQNRIQAEIVNIDPNGGIIPGKDRNIPLTDLPVCIPLLTEFLHARPKVGECVLLIAENPTDLTSVRYWIGPLISNQARLPFQPYEETVNIYNIGSFRKKNIHESPTLQNQIKQNQTFPSQGEIAIQGREDADVLFKPREINIRVGKFKVNSNTELNTENPCRITIKQFDVSPNLTGIRNIDQKINDNFVPFSQINIEATSINLVSNEGKYKNYDSNDPESISNPRLKDFGQVALQLHPLVLGDNLVELLKVMILHQLTHSHLPQNPAIKSNLSSKLEEYISSQKINEILSKNVRTN